MFMVVILDYGSSIKQNSCHAKPERVGTIPYLAPEMEIEIYDQSVDLWACGVIGLQFFATKGKLPWRHVIQNKERFRAGKLTYDQQMAHLKAAAPDLMENLLRLLAWDAPKRGTAHDALQYKSFSHVRLRARPEGNKHACSP
ncbi:hypothetical protein OIDMADRAFT_61805 [Oidiodendron maius Zn]|uniref:Protein kinase domain-containing protein n=1 Tax=Oidiodendron maius (strain Zn) TaxID=913774 RepID=A0A0C3C2R1_OIDMZ|nr:hypothetical protein OIDMADRAFT_61805 [Oidiodendron maius Zn]